jgi:protein ImuA
MAEPTLAEVFAAPAAASAAAALALANHSVEGADRPLLWVQDRLSRIETGAPYGPALGRPFLHVAAHQPALTLAAMEEGLRSGAVAAVLGEIWGEPAVADFTATRRLAMRAEASGTPCWLIRHAAAPALSAARLRLRVAPWPSAPHPDDPQAPGDPCWRVTQFRARGARTGDWVIRHDPKTHHLHILAALSDGHAAADAARPARRARRADGRGAAWADGP